MKLWRFVRNIVIPSFVVFMILWIVDILDKSNSGTAMSAEDIVKDGAGFVIEMPEYGH